MISFSPLISIPNPTDSSAGVEGLIVKECWLSSNSLRILEYSGKA